mmetsp:Transcript_37352/g.99440  ORF Transcript_37352/g.99440 Transcript_37352/m.99440 type:complete len:462 (+) Transcript_37352:1408-2793(+)
MFSYRLTLETKIIWISPSGYILFELFKKKTKEIEDFLVTVSEPVSRTKKIQEFVLTPYALYAAVTSGLYVWDILKIIIKLSKNLLPKMIYKMILNCTKFYGKVNLILYKCNYFIYIPSLFLLKFLLTDLKVSKTFPNLTWYLKRAFKFKSNKINYLNNIENKLIIETNFNTIDIEKIRKRFLELDCPLVEEYDYIHDTHVLNIKIDFSPTAYIRNYQEKSLSKIFNKGRARSGVIVLPCGAGKTIIGIIAVCIIKKISLVVCNSTVSVEQWKRQFLKWSNLKDKKIKKFITGSFEMKKNITGEIVITTYSMISFGGQRARLSASLLREIKKDEWGVTLLDEVHVVPANVFRKVLGIIKTHSKLGLTATLLREDRKVGDINFLIGPKLYETNWLDLEKFGYLATACCAEICCNMPSDYYSCYLSESISTRQVLCALNPNKAEICDFFNKISRKKRRSCFSIF